MGNASLERGKSIGNVAFLRARIRELEAERDVLEKKLSEASITYTEMHLALESLQDENKTLREALEGALDKILTLYAWSDQVGLYDIEETPAVVKARAALEEKEDQTNE